MKKAKSSDVTPEVKALKKKVKTLQRQTQRQRVKINNLKELMAELKDKKMLESEPAALLSNSFTGMKLELLQNEVSDAGHKPKGCRYSQELKQFAITLHYYSPQAYRYVKSILQLPDESSLKNWLSNVDCKPGFLVNVIAHVAKMDLKDFSLVIDSMAIRKMSVYDPHSGEFRGSCDYGQLVGESPEAPATEALVFLLVPLRGSHQYPLGYFYVDKINSSVQTQLVTNVLKLTSDAGLIIRNITFDGAAANITMANNLGVDVMNLPANTAFSHPCLPDVSVQISLDACHMLKLARNALAEFQAFKTEDGKLIEWKYISQLCSFQHQEGLTLANKLTRTHLEWRKAKMKVKLAAQTFSTSVADALEFLSSVDPNFAGAGPTIEFIRQVH